MNTPLQAKIDKILDYVWHDAAQMSGGSYLNNRKTMRPAEAKAQILQAVKDCIPDIEKHYCPFNDGEQTCPCFKEAIDQMNKCLGDI